MFNRVATQGVPGFADGFASEALLREPNGLALDQSRQELYVADQGNHAIRVIDLSSRRITTVAALVDQRMEIAVSDIQQA